jgi:hypothetical protein
MSALAAPPINASASCWRGWKASACSRRYARKTAAIEMAGPPQRRYNNTLRALASLPVKGRPA